MYLIKELIIQNKPNVVSSSSCMGKSKFHVFVEKLKI